MNDRGDLGFTAFDGLQLRLRNGLKIHDLPPLKPGTATPGLGWNVQRDPGVTLPFRSVWASRQPVSASTSPQTVWRVIHWFDLQTYFA
jgi:hypothetical protein